jgi:hypothetical protein
MSLIVRLFWLVCAALSLLWAFAQAAFYLRKSAFRDLKIPDQALTAPHFHTRFKHYFFGTTYLALLYGTFHGRQRHRRDFKRFALLSALTSYFDDLTDAWKNKTIMPEALSTPESYGRATDPAGLALHFLQQLYHELSSEQLRAVKKDLNKIFELETRPKNTQDLAIRMELGAFSVLLFRHLLDWPMVREEERAWLGFGAFIQLCDDIFDIWHDQHHDIMTPVVEMASANEMGKIMQLFEDQEKRMKANFSDVPQFWRRQLLLAQIHWLCGMTRFCLLRYKKMWASSGQLPLQNRKKMVTDMGLWRNRWGAVWQTMKTKW